MEKFEGHFKEINEYQGKSVQHFIRNVESGTPKVVTITASTVSSAGPSGVWQQFQCFFKNAFLPVGYPDSVSEDYFDYQLWDSLQAFASSISGSLATQAVLKGVGVGDEDATPLAATVTWLLRHGSGMIGSIIFTWLQGSDLDHNCKKWRLFADFANDFAMCLELSWVWWPSEWFQYVLCSASVCRALVGVAGGATRTAITQHQAKSNNISDVAARDGSQETLVNLAALVVNLIILPVVSEDQNLIWMLFSLMTFLHLFCNYKAVKSLMFETFNRDRLSIVLQTFSNTSQVISPRACNVQETPFWSWNEGHNKNIFFGSSLTSCLMEGNFKTIKQTLKEDGFCIVTTDQGTNVILSNKCNATDHFRAYCQAYAIAEGIANFDFEDFHQKARLQGWRTNHLQIQTLGWKGIVK